MVYSLKIVPINPDALKMPRYTVQVEEISPGNVSSLAVLDEKLVSKLNQYLFEEDIELDDGLFDKVDESMLFNSEDSEEESCPHCGR